MKTLLHNSKIFIFIILLTQTVVFGTTITSTATAGNWTVASTWMAVSRVGTITTTGGSKNVVGTGTFFLTELSVGSILKTTGGVTIGTVASITDDTALTLVANATSGSLGMAFTAQVVPLASDDVIISAGSVVTITANAIAKSVNILGTLSINDGIRLTAFGDFSVNMGGSFDMLAENGAQNIATLIVYGNYNNNGFTDFWKGDVVITGDLLSPSSSNLQNNGNVVVGGNIIGAISLTGGIQQNPIYAVNPNAIIEIVNPTIDSAVMPGVQVLISAETQYLVDLVNSVIYGGSCPFTITEPTSTSTCSGSNAVFTVTTTGTSPAYQWQINQNDGSGWVNLTNVTPYSGVTTSTLTISVVTVAMTNYKYRAKITSGSCTKNGNYGILTVNTANTWTGTTDTNWFTATNWSCGSIPILATDVIIPNVTNQPIIDDTNRNTAFANTLTIALGSSLVVKSNNTLKIKDILTNNGGTITFEDSASLVQTNNVSNIGNITYKRTTPDLIHTDYTYWSSPVAFQTLFNVSPATLSGMFYSFDAATETWLNESSANTMVLGKGYIIRGPEPGITLAPYTASFIGKPNNGDISISIPGGVTSNLIGNPYPSAIDANLFLDANATAIDGTLYFWTHNTKENNGQYTSADYAVYNRTGGVIIDGMTYLIGGTGASGKNNSAPNGKIAAGQAFFTTGTSLGGTVTFTNAMRVDNLGNTLDNSQFFKSRNPKVKTAIEKNRIWLNLTNSQGAFKQTLVGYITDATNDYDSRFDGESFDGNEFIDFYSINQDKNLVIQGRALPFDENDEVPLGFRTTINGDFTVNIDQADGLLSSQAVYIEDKLTNTVTNLKSGNYTFNAVAGTFNDRFVLKYANANKTLSVNKTDKEKGILILYSNNYKTLMIHNNVIDATINSVALFSTTGQKISNWNVKNREQTNIQIPIKNISSGIYIVKINTTIGESVKKIIVN